MRVKFILSLFIFMTIVGCGSDKEDGKNQQDEYQAIKQQIDLTKSFELTFVNSGDTLVLQKDKKNLKLSQNDKIIIFNFFTTWADACLAQIPHLINLQEKYSDSIRIIGLLMDDKNDAQTKKFIDEYNATHHHPINFEISNGENNFYLSQILGDVNGIPFTVIYNEEGKRMVSFSGAAFEEFLEMEIKKVLN